MTKEVEPEHALLSASGSGVWIPCPGSLALLHHIGPPGEEENTEASDRGTRLHKVMEQFVKTRRIPDVVRSLSEEDRDAIFFCTDHEVMNEFLQLEELFTELKVRYAEDLGVPSHTAYGTGDLVGYEALTKTVQILDYKFGRWRVPVEWNSQLMLYALGAKRFLEEMFGWPVERFDFYTMQPKLETVGEWSCSLKELNDFTQSASASAKIALRCVDGGEDHRPHLVAGPHCQDKWCKMRSLCRVNADYVTKEAIEGFDNLEEALDNGLPLKNVDVLSVEELDQILLKKDLISGWLKAVGAKALQMALNGEEFPNHEVGESRKNRVFRESDLAVSVVRELGLTDKEIYKTELRTPAQIEKALPKKSRGLIAPYIVKPPGDKVLKRKKESLD